MITIQSFQVDHDKLRPGLYISRQDGDVLTFDLRTRTPNAGDYMSNVAMHSVEHLFAAILRNSAIGDHVLYFGPMGCRTGFYLLTRGLEPERVRAAIFDAIETVLAWEGPIPGQSRRECGNYRELDLDAAKAECLRYREVLKNDKREFRYET